MRLGKGKGGRVVRLGKLEGWEHGEVGKVEKVGGW